MAVIYSYPKATPTSADLLIGTLTSDASGENPTKSFSIADIIGLVPAAGTGGTVTSVGLTNTDTFLTIGNSPITTAGNISINLTNNGGTPGNTTFYRGDGQWAAPVGTGNQKTYALSSQTNALNTDVILTETDSTGATVQSVVKLIPNAPISIANNNSNSEITIGSSALTGITAASAAGTATAPSFIVIDSSAPATPTIALTAAGLGTPAANYSLRGDGTWGLITSGGTMSSWNLTADSGSPEQVDNAETVTITGGSGIDTSVAATNTVTVALASTVPQTIAAGVTSQVYDAANTTKNLAVSGTQSTTISLLNVLSNSTDAYTTPKVNNVISLTQTEYNGITPDANTLYIIV